MHFIKEIPCEEVKILLYEWNSKYILKYELGSFEQTIKLSILDFTSQKEMEELATSSSIIQQIISNVQQLSQRIGEQL
jgi:predicted house-cleaning noncanonical NTP pyrophosphatase (MazG superfamily)